MWEVMTGLIGTAVLGLIGWGYTLALKVNTHTAQIHAITDRFDRLEALLMKVYDKVHALSERG